MQADKKHPPERAKTGSGMRRTGSRSPWLVFSGAALEAALLLKPDFAGARASLAAAYRAAGMPDSAALVEGGK